jgi:hypothetical protein
MSRQGFGNKCIEIQLPNSLIPVVLMALYPAVSVELEGVLS